MPDAQSVLEPITKIIQTATVVAGVVVSILSFNDTRQKEAAARKLASAQPFLELRQKRYLEAVHAASVLASPSEHSKEEIEASTKSFWELYYGDLALVEEKNVAEKMISFSETLAPPENLSQRHNASLDLAHSLRDSLLKSWGVDENTTGDVPFKPTAK